jgi:putative ABC transport system permease protein
VRSDAQATRLGAELRRRARDVDAEVPLDVGSLQDLFRGTLATRVLTLSLLSAFSAIAMILAAVGIYGVLSYAVAQRTRELAVRAALGATRGGLLALVLRSGLRVVIAGVVVGLVGAMWAARIISSMLVDVAPFDPWSYAVAVALLVVVSVLAILVPARRATRLDPMLALSAE